VNVEEKETVLLESEFINFYFQGMNEIVGPIYFVFSTDPNLEWRSKLEICTSASIIPAHVVTKCQPVCPMPTPPGWANVYIIHSVGHIKNKTIPPQI
jgi:hypothetical protein